MNTDPVQQKQALAIEGVLLNIFGYLIGNDIIIDSIVTNLSMRLVSSRFNICFISYLRSAPLRLKYYSLEEGFRQRHILMWLIRHEITTITKSTSVSLRLLLEAVTMIWLTLISAISSHLLYLSKLKIQEGVILMSKTFFNCSHKEQL